MNLDKIPSISSEGVHLGPIAPSMYGTCSCWYPFLLKSILRKNSLGDYSKFQIPSFLPNSYFGTVIHKLLEERVKGNVPDETTYYEKWEDLLYKKEQRIKENYPLVTKFDLVDYDKMYASCKSVMSVSPLPQASMSGGGCSKSTEVGIKFGDYVKGAIDRVKKSNEGIELVDYKTGKVLDEDGNIKLQYIYQLNIYAICYEETFGENVTKLTIVQTDLMTEYSVPLQRERFAEIVSDIKALHTNLSEALRDNNISTYQNINDECGYCSYRHLCDSYKALPNNDPYIVCGRVHQYGNNGTIVLLRDDGQECSISKMQGLHSSDGGSIIGKDLIIINPFILEDTRYKKGDRTIVFEK